MSIFADSAAALAAHSKAPVGSVHRISDEERDMTETTESPRVGERILKALSEKPPMTMAALAELLDMDVERLSAMLVYYRKQGKVTHDGGKPAALWTLANRSGELAARAPVDSATAASKPVAAVPKPARPAPDAPKSNADDSARVLALLLHVGTITQEQVDAARLLLR